MIKTTRKGKKTKKMEEIKVGEYVRTKYGEIGIITSVFPRLMWRKKKNPSLVDSNEIVKHSLNIIDLIEERRLCEWC